MGSRKCFIMLPWKHKEFFDRHVQSMVQGAGLEYAVMDNSRMGQIPATIYDDIRQSIVCIADISGHNANVAYELGIAHSLNKKTIIVSRDPPDDAPTDFRHWEIVRYSANAPKSLLNRLKPHLKRIANEELLRWMLIPPPLMQSKGPFVIAASPLSWQERGKPGGYPILTTTQVENVGIKSLLLEFGRLFQSEPEPDLLNPGDYLDDVIEKQQMNLYCLGSSKANRWTGRVLRRLAEQWKPAIEFHASRTTIYLRDPDVDMVIEGEIYSPTKATHVMDIGLIIRAPSPYYRENMVTVLAGRRGCGTEAACLAATNLRILKEIDDKCDLEQFATPFFAVVKMRKKGYADKCAQDLTSLELIRCERLSKR